MGKPFYQEVDPKYGENRHAELRWVVPAERCKHGMIDGHYWLNDQEHREQWCPGAGIGGSNEQ